MLSRCRPCSFQSTRRVAKAQWPDRPTRISQRSPGTSGPRPFSVITSTRLQQRTLPGRPTKGHGSTAPPLAFAFDIDGVLIQGKNVLPEAKRALKMLEGDNAFRMPIPYVLITNGGGTPENARSQRLSDQLGVKIPTSKVIQAHTMLKSVAHKYHDDAVLVLGGRPGVLPKLAEEYGFRKVYSTLDILAWNPSIWPFHDLDHAERVYVQSREPFDPNTRISAVFVFHDPRNWSLDIQIVCDVLRHRGFLTKDLMHKHVSSGDDNAVDLIFCNPDLLWRNDFPTSRIGQGGFRVAFQAVYKALTGSQYPYKQYGKPTKATYDFATDVLRRQLELTCGTSVTEPNMYMIGDNPMSDIAGANTAGWFSALVKSGVYDPDDGEPSHKPTIIVDDVEKAVRWAIKREYRNYIRKN